MLWLIGAILHTMGILCIGLGLFGERDIMWAIALGFINGATVFYVLG